MIGSADFLCAVVPAGPVASNVYFELGVAAGLNKPRLAFVEPKADLPLALREQPYARITLANGEALRFHLDAFLKNAKASSRELPSHISITESRSSNGRATAALEVLSAWEAQGHTPGANELLLLVADVFAATGYVSSIGSIQEEFRHGFDLAVWIDELQSAIGNPLLIEIVTRPKPTPEKMQLLQHALRTSQGTLGLIVYWDSSRSNIDQTAREPMIIAMSARDLVESVVKDDFARTLLMRRNAVVHSAA